MTSEASNVITLKKRTPREALTYATMQIMKLTSENAKLREALKIYANSENWTKDDWGIVSVFCGGDKGYGNPTGIAEEALK